MKKEIKILMIVGMIGIAATSRAAAETTQKNVVFIKEDASRCTDPSTLPENLKKAYEALKASGHDVKASCYPESKKLTAEQLKAIAALR